MNPPLLPTPPSQPTHGRTLRRWRAYIHPGPLRSGVFFGAIIFSTLIMYTTFLSESPRGTLWDRPLNWPGISRHEPPVQGLEHTSIPDVLTVEQIRDIVAPTKGFFTRDYSLGLGWNNVSMRHVF